MGIIQCDCLSVIIPESIFQRAFDCLTCIRVPRHFFVKIRFYLGKVIIQHFMKLRERIIVVLDQNEC